MKYGSAQGTSPELLALLQGHATEITRLMSSHWSSVVNGQERWPTLRRRNDEANAEKLRRLFILYVDKTLHWLDYFIRDPRWLNLSAVNHAANAAREAANEVRDARSAFEVTFELDRDDLMQRRPAPQAEPTLADLADADEERPAA